MKNFEKIEILRNKNIKMADVCGVVQNEQPNPDLEQ